MTNLLILKHRHGRAFHSLCLRLSLLTAGTNLWKVYKWTLISQTNKVFTLQWLIVRITSPQSLSKFLASGRVPIYSSLSGAFCAIQLRLYAKSRYSLPYKVRLKQIDLLPASWRFSEIHSIRFSVLLSITAPIRIIAWENSRHLATLAYRWLPGQLTSEKRAQKFHTDDAPLPRSG